MSNDDKTQLITLESNHELTNKKPKRSDIRKGFTKMDAAPIEVQRAALMMDSQGLARTTIARLLKTDYDFDIDVQTVRKYLKDNQGRTDILYGSEQAVSKIKDDYMQVIASLLDTHKKLKLSLDKAIEAGEWGNVAKITGIMNNNVSTASDIMKKLPDSKNDKSITRTETIGLMLETL
jgi:hypothetical protein